MTDWRIEFKSDHPSINDSVRDVDDVFSTNPLIACARITKFEVRKSRTASTFHLQFGSIQIEERNFSRER